MMSAYDNHHDGFQTIKVFVCRRSIDFEDAVRRLDGMKESKYAGKREPLGENDLFAISSHDTLE